MTNLARSTDPSTSHEAAAHIEAKLGELQYNALLAVKKHPGKTALELEQADGVMRSTYGRRMTELRRKGYIVEVDKRRCSVSGRSACTWRLSFTGWGLFGA